MKQHYSDHPTMKKIIKDHPDNVYTKSDTHTSILFFKKFLFDGASRPSGANYHLMTYYNKEKSIYIILNDTFNYSQIYSGFIEKYDSEVNSSEARHKVIDCLFEAEEVNFEKKVEA